MPSVPTKSGLVKSTKTGGMTGGAAALGKNLGRGVLGPGLGTVAGGMVAAASMKGDSRKYIAASSMEDGIAELLFRGSGGGTGGRGTM